MERENEAGLSRMKEEYEAIKRRNQSGQAAVDRRNAEKQKLVTNRDAEIAVIKERNRRKQEEVAGQNQAIDAENQVGLKKKGFDK